MNTMRAVMISGVVGAIMLVVAPGSAAPAPAPGAPTINQLRHLRRVLIVSAPNARDAAFRSQMKILAVWKDQGQLRDITVVSIVGDEVAGASDTAVKLRHRLGLPAGVFATALIGKDGHLALKAMKPLASLELERTIDAMPMRRAGGR